MRRFLLLLALLTTVGCGSSLPPAKSSAELQSELQSDKPEVRLKAAESLAKMGPGAVDAIDALFAAIEKDADLKVRRAAALAIGDVAIDQALMSDRLDKLASKEREGEVKAALFHSADAIRNARKLSIAKEN